MRDYGDSSLGTWVDFNGRSWPLIKSKRRLKFQYPAHAAIRAHVFNRDGFKCAACGAKALDVPTNYTGRNTLSTNTLLKSGYSDVLVVDHVLSLSAGGLNVIENMQTLCETCNKRKQRTDSMDSKKFREIPGTANHQERL